MARDFFAIEKGLDVYGDNGPLLARILTGTATPDGTSGGQDVAPIGSIYLRSGTGALYQKLSNNGNSADWELNGSAAATVGKWRPEKVVAVTGDVLSAGSINLTSSPFTDDNSPLLTASDFTAGDYIISDADGSPALWEVTSVSSPSITIAAAGTALAAEDTFIVVNYLPDPAGGENRAIVNYNGSINLTSSPFTDDNSPLLTASDFTVGKWRPEKVVAVTGDVLSAGSINLTSSPFTDDNSPLLTAIS